MNKKPLIIILSGTCGVGKTALAHQLSVDLQIMQRASFSAITQTIKTIIPNNPIVKKWFFYDQMDISSVKLKLRREAKLVGKVIYAIADNSTIAGENYVIEGVQLLPEFLPMDKVLFFYIHVSDENKHREQFCRPTVTRVRHVTNASYDLVKKVDMLIKQGCEGYDFFSVDNIGTIEEASKKIIQMIKKAHPNYLKEYLWYEKNS